ncbi:Alpha/Beta hydrolase protein [Massariosphaeria phaeospora]|uniref:Carboxylic ester hydrolase n=1 Tax=Massariosphaeria phaeospora TaxID=100035 RepID=A0A7C8I112_9PLEO|nr:Alpha/Beta hydrolase protein [Massariosphaeria phaeospora]
MSSSMPSCFLFRFILILPILTPLYHAAPLVTLDYGTFAGAHSTEYNLAHFRRIPFGASTAGRNRFRAPQPPAPINNGTYDSDRAFDMCPQRSTNGSEDCLYLGLYARPWTTVQPLRPVLLSLYGGGFVQGSASFGMPPPSFPVLNVSAANDYVFVSANYRTNVFGFLAGAKVKEHVDVDLNVGLLDQRAALEWVQKYVHHFGGDRANVTIWGQSAGGGSVVAQTIAAGNRGKGLFAKAMASSPFWPKTYRYDSPESEALYERVVQDVGCAGAEDEISCLKNADVQALRKSSLAISTSHQYTTSTFTWGPVIDDSFLSSPLSTVIRDEPFNVDLVLTSYNMHEGENFVPPGFLNATGAGGFNASSASFEDWLKGFLPELVSEDLQQVNRMYPESGEAESTRWNTTYERAGMLYRDLVLACPAYWLARKAEKGWLMHYMVDPAKHASDTNYWYMPNLVQISDRVTYEGYVGAMASFVQTGDPNTHKITNESVVGVPRVSEGKQFVVRKNEVGEERADMLEKRCDFWLEISGRVPI